MNVDQKLLKPAFLIANRRPLVTIGSKTVLNDFDPYFSSALAFSIAAYPVCLLRNYLSCVTRQPAFSISVKQRRRSAPLFPLHR